MTRAVFFGVVLLYGVKLTGGNVGVSGKKRTLPHYMTMFLEPARL